MVVSIPFRWKKLAGRLAAGSDSVVLILGEPGSGKTYLAAYLAGQLAARRRRVVLVDGDTGQSMIGPPATVGFAPVRGPVPFGRELAPAAMAFTGAATPAADLGRYTAAFRRILGKAKAAGSMIIVNTPGWVRGAAGESFVGRELGIVRPDVIVLLERNDELEYVPRLVRAHARERGSVRILRPGVPRTAVLTTSAERAALRERSFRRYFAKARTVSFSRARIAAKYAPREGTWDARGLVVGLSDDRGDTLALGIFLSTTLTVRSFRIRTPLPARCAARVRSIEFGSIRFTPGWTEKRKE